MQITLHFFLSTKSSAIVFVVVVVVFVSVGHFWFLCTPYYVGWCYIFLHIHACKILYVLCDGPCSIANMVTH